jgi:hypothetical protein
MKKPCLISKVISGRLLTLRAGNWYVASISLTEMRKPDAAPVTVIIRSVKVTRGRWHVVAVHNFTPRWAREFINDFNTSGPFGFNGRKWATR